MKKVRLDTKMHPNHIESHPRVDSTEPPPPPNDVELDGASSSDYKKMLIRGLIDRKYECRWCELKFYQKKHLLHHEQHAHNDKTVVCPVCDKTFAGKDRLNGHMICHMEPSLECKVLLIFYLL